MTATTTPYQPAEAALIAEAREIIRRYMASGPVISCWDVAEDYCRTAFAGEAGEVFRVLYLDRKNRLIEDHIAGRGTVDHVPAYPREVMKRALEVNATAMIITHNHPSGDPEPSRDDIDMTGQIDRAAKTLGIALHDHIIVGGDRVHSMRGAGQI